VSNVNGFIKTRLSLVDINSGPAVILPITDMNAVPERFWGSPFFGAFAPNEHVSFWSLNLPGSLEIVQFAVFPRITNIQIPTLSEWGLIAVAGVLGIVGFIVIRRRKVTA